jgi:succinoglycan biosynthesis transport protein ExoP
VSPSTNTAPRILLMVLVGSVGAAVALALLLDRLDRRLRYPDQVMRDLRLGIVGAVPSVGAKRGPASLDEAANVVEAFRATRVYLQHASPPGVPIRLTISSPGQGDGKSLVSANLALSFAEVGYRTLLLDGDTRRGGLHGTFAVERRPGLTDYLAGAATLAEITRPTSHEHLTLIPCGTRTRTSPELLASPQLVQLLADLERRFDVILIDSPPLGAGIDAFLLGVASGRMLLVLRSGETDRKLAQAKLDLLDRLPVSVLGAVLNDIPAAGVYRYYSYLAGYEADEEMEPAVGGRAGTRELTAAR